MLSDSMALSGKAARARSFANHAGQVTVPAWAAAITC